MFPVTASESVKLDEPMVVVVPVVGADWVMVPAVTVSV